MIIHILYIILLLYIHKIILDKMDFLPIINRNKRKKNVFGVFYNQNFKTIGLHSLPKEREKNEIKSDLIFLSKVPITNQSENIPAVEKDEIKKIDLDIDTKTKNDDILLDVKSKACLEDIDNQKPLSNLDVKVDEVSTMNTQCNIVEKNLIIPSVKEKIIDIDNKAIVKHKNDNIIVKKREKNNIFKRFKYK